MAAAFFAGRFFPLSRLTRQTKLFVLLRLFFLLGSVVLPAKSCAQQPAKESEGQSKSAESVQQGEPGLGKRRLRVQHIRDVSVGRGVQGVAWSDDDQTIAYLHGFGSGFEIRSAGGKLLRSYEMSPASVDPAIGMTSKYVVTTVSPIDGPDAMLKLWSRDDDSTVILPGPRPGGGPRDNREFTFSMSGDERVVAAYTSPAGQEHVSVVDLTTFNRRDILASDIIGVKDTVSSIALSPDGQLLAVGTAQSKVFLTKVSDPLHAIVIQDFGHKIALAEISAMAFARDGRRLASGRFYPNPDPEVGSPIGVSSLDGRDIERYVPDERIIKQLSWAANGEYLAAVTGNQDAILVNLEDGSTTNLWTTHNVLALAFSHHGSTLALADNETLRFFTIFEK